MLVGVVGQVAKGAIHIKAKIQAFVFKRIVKSKGRLWVAVSQVAHIVDVQLAVAVQIDVLYVTNVRSLLVLGDVVRRSDEPVGFPAVYRPDGVVLANERSQRDGRVTFYPE